MSKESSTPLSVSERTRAALADAKARGVVLGSAGARNLQATLEKRTASADQFARRQQPVFAELQALGTGAETCSTTAATLGALRDELIARGGAAAQALARGKAVRMAHNQVLSDESARLSAGDEVAFFPPVTGG